MRMETMAKIDDTQRIKYDGGDSKAGGEDSGIRRSI